MNSRTLSSAMLISVFVFQVTNRSWISADEPADQHAEASSVREGTSPGGAIDADRFAVDSNRIWSGSSTESNWWWQCRWTEPRAVGAILQIVGDDPVLLRNAPRKYVWQSSLNGRDWLDLESTKVNSESRCFRLHRLQSPQRLRVLANEDRFCQWRIPVDSRSSSLCRQQGTDRIPRLDHRRGNHRSTRVGQNRSAKGSNLCPWRVSVLVGENVLAQYVWLDRFDEDFVAIEPHPLCAFLSGNFSDFCQKDRLVWRGTDEIVKAGRLPIWAACGGAQALAILADTGFEKPWDCPHCRDPQNPKSPIYGHIDHPLGLPRKCSELQPMCF